MQLIIVAFASVSECDASIDGRYHKASTDEGIRLHDPRGPGPGLGKLNATAAASGAQMPRYSPNLNSCHFRAEARTPWLSRSRAPSRARWSTYGRARSRTTLIPVALTRPISTHGTSPYVEAYRLSQWRNTSATISRSSSTASTLSTANTMTSTRSSPPQV